MLIEHVFIRTRLEEPSKSILSVQNTKRLSIYIAATARITSLAACHRKESNVNRNAASFFRLLSSAFPLCSSLR